MNGSRRILWLIAVCGAFSVATAYAQTSASPPVSPSERAPTSPTGLGRFRDRFAAANTTHDGRLTRAQAEAGRLRMVARNFDAIDADHKGYVTLDDIRGFVRARRAAPDDAPR